MKSIDNIRASVIGASGYSGIELVRLLSRHPNVTLGSLIANSSAGKAFADISLHHVSGGDVEIGSYSPEAVASSDVVFIALPSGEAMNITSDLVASGKRVIDLGGDFRLQDVNEYKSFYGRDHGQTELLGDAVYGLPELNRDAISQAKFVSNPGCYATSVIVPLVPLVKSGVIDGSKIVVNTLSGISGAGKKSTFEYSFTELNDSILAYRVGGKHQHIPEIKQAVKEFGGSNISMTFVPHLAPITRGIHSTITAPLAANMSTDSIATAFAQYQNEPFIALSPNVPPALRRVQHTNMIEIGWCIDETTNTLVVFSTIDNLLKGAAGQAVQNMNIMFGFDETTGL
ncbi:MAG TPA: N-acetyl-gamma-glutamyl-phosphate reductase [Candidatus Kapabacteria bacterium]|nr:N-acetyl-gamma-glutamyl-phosphate reductase [Candidatus Kapabacteria bacterium]